MTYVWTQAFLPRHWIKMQMTHSYNESEKWLVRNHFQFSFSFFLQVYLIITLSQEKCFFYYFFFESMVGETFYSMNKNQPSLKYENVAQNSTFQNWFCPSEYCLKVSKSRKKICCPRFSKKTECWGIFMYWKMPQRSFFWRI